MAIDLKMEDAGSAGQLPISPLPALRCFNIRPGELRWRMKRLIAEEHWREFVETPTPGQKLMRGIRRHVSGVLDSDFIESLVISVEIARVFPAAAAAENHFHLLSKTRRSQDVVSRNDTATKKADVRKHVQML